MTLQQGLIVETQQRLRQFVVLIAVETARDARCLHEHPHQPRLVFLSCPAERDQ